MNILLTGGDGLVGSNIREYNDNRSPELRHNIYAPTSSEVDLLDREQIASFFESHTDIDCVIHAAGKVGGIHTNMVNLASFMHDNMVMGFNLVSCAQFYGVKNFINFGTSCMYPADSVSPISEERIFEGKLHPSNAGYAIAKSAIAKYCEFIGGNYKTIIPCNLYGRYDKFHPDLSHMLPAAIRKLHLAKESGDKVTIWGDGSAEREFMYAQDVADFTFYCVENIDEMPQYVNLGLKDDLSIKQLYEIAADVVGYDNGFEYDLTKPVGVLKKKCDITKLEEFGWENKYTTEQGIRETYEYFKTIADKV